MDKEAVAQGFWIIMLAAITIIGLLFTLNLFGKTKDVSETLVDYHICREGNRGVVKTRFQVFDWVLAEKGVKHCKTEQVKVKKDKEYDTIAKKMALCWNEYLEGKEAVFKTQDANYCAFCSVLEFEENNKQLNGLSKYLIETKYQPTGKSYMEYFSEVKVVKEQANFLENLELNNVNIDTSKKLAVMFVMYKDAYPDSLINQPRTFTAGAGTAIAGASGIFATAISYIGGLGLCSTLVGCAAGAILIGGAGGMTGYMIGSDRSEDWRAKILVTEYDKEKLSQLKCTQLEGEDYLKLPEKT